MITPNTHLSRNIGVSNLVPRRENKHSNAFRLKPGMGSPILLLILLLAACHPGPTPNPATLAPVSTSTPLPSATLVATSTPTVVAPSVLLIVPPQADPVLAAKVQHGLEQLASQSGLRYSVQPGLNTQELTPDVKIVVALAPVEGMEFVASASLSVQFIALGIPGLKSAANLNLIGASDRPDQQGFMAGVIAAILTEDWRVGVITLSDSPAGKAVGLGFHNGVVYFCGLCRPYNPPFVAYPVVAQLPSDANQGDWQNAVQSMISQGVKTVYVFPGAGDDAMLTALDQAGVHIIGSVPPASAHKANWVASLRVDMLPALQKAWPQVLAGNGGLNLPAELTITDINPDLFSSGKQDLANKIMNDLLSGFIDTQVDPQTGEAH